MAIKRPVHVDEQGEFCDSSDIWLTKEERTEAIACINHAPALAEALRFHLINHPAIGCGMRTGDTCPHCKLLAAYDKDMNP